MHSSYPNNPTTIGEHIRKKRIDLELSQIDIARVFEVNKNSITAWEMGRSIPQTKYFPKIIQFLGYCPAEVDTSSFSGRLKSYLLKNGLSAKAFAKILKIDPKSMVAWEKGKVVPSDYHLDKILPLLEK